MSFPKLTPSQHQVALLMLVVACVFWGVSFPLTKALAMMMEQRLPMENSMLYSAFISGMRFVLGAVILTFFLYPHLKKIGRKEIGLGVGSAIFGGIGNWLQMDAIQYTHASTSAFLTQLYCILIPIYATFLSGRLPRKRIITACLMAITGVAVLAQIDFRNFHLGRGEWETLLASCFFMGQILWIERKQYEGKNPLLATWVMFAVASVVFLPITAFSVKEPMTFLSSMPSTVEWSLLLALTFTGTIGAYLIMNHWQPKVSASEAGIIYTFEPVFASGFALLFPSLLATWGGIQYANETLTSTLLLGGGLIFLSNFLLCTKTKEGV